MNAILANMLRKKQSLLAVLAIICSFIIYFLLPPSIPEAARRVAAVFVFAVFFWALEIIPLFATSFLVVILLSFLLTMPGNALGLGVNGFHLFLVPFSSPVIMLFLGGFVLAIAARKHQVDIFLMRKALSRIGHRSHILLLGFLLISAFFSMWMSNTAAAAMMLMLLKPIFVHIEEHDPLRKGLVLSIAFGASIGGIGTPIGTPPNAIAIGMLADEGIYINFLQWMLIAVPLALLALAITAVILLLFFRPKYTHIYYRIQHVKLKGKGVSVLIIAIFVILLWLTKPIHGVPEALTALLGVGLFAAFELISAEDLRHINWDILVLMWGGLALGEGLEISGILEHFLPFLSKYGTGVFFILGTLTLVLSTFISNTAAANLVLPIAVSIASIDKTHLTLALALICSFGFALPISTPPNAIVYATGAFKPLDMLKTGALISVIGYLLILFIFGYIIPNMYTP